jgi:hypothetical protein
MLLTECYQKLLPWLCIPPNRKSRFYLETHLQLLDDEFARFLELFVSENDASPYRQHLSTLYCIWQDARARGSTKQAVSEAYVNALGGLILDVPNWLWEAEQQRSPFLASSRTERSVAVYKMQLRATIDRALTEKLVAPEIIAELQYQLGNCFVHAAHHQSMTALQTSVDYYHASLHVYSASQYPQQHAKVQTALDKISPNLFSMSS